MDRVVAQLVLNSILLPQSMGSLFDNPSKQVSIIEGTITERRFSGQGGGGGGELHHHMNTS